MHIVIYLFNALKSLGLNGDVSLVQVLISGRSKYTNYKLRFGELDH